MSSQSQSETQPHAQSDMVLSKLLIKYKLADKHQIGHALVAQKKALRNGNPMPLGQVLVAQGALTQERLDYLISLEKFMRTRQQDRAFCEIAVKHGYVTVEQIEQAMKEQLARFKKDGAIVRIPPVLVGLRMIQEEAVGAIQALVKSAIAAKGKGAAPTGPGTLQQTATGSDVRCTAEPTESERKSISAGTYFRICVKEGAIAAFLTKIAPPPPELQLNHLKALIESTGIKHGLVSDQALEAFIRQENPPEEWPLAKGTPAKPSVDAKIEYFFDTDPIKVGTAKAGGAIDFRERGERPVIKEGSLLARRTPPVKGTPGIDVMGKPIPVNPPKDMKILVGAGIKLSEDKTEAYAGLTGCPELTAYGKLFVHPELVINGDVNMETGNVNFEGSINVHGVVEDGFTIRGGNLSANEIRKATVEVTGDVVVFGGLVGARIICDGNVRARYIHGSTIHCAGDVIAEMLMVNSDIEASGAVFAKNGKILSSNVTARRGIEGGIIGSEKSKACFLRVGVDAKFEKKSGALRESIDEKLKLRETTIEQLQSNHEESHELEEKIGEMAQMQDRSMVQHRQTINRIAELKKADNFENDGEIRRLEALLPNLEKRAKEAEQELEKLLDKQDAMKDDIAKSSQPIKELDGELNKLKSELSELMLWESEQPRDPVVKAHGEIMSGTEIKGRYANLTLKNNAHRVIVRETDTHAKEGADRTAPRWQMTVVPLM